MKATDLMIGDWVSIKPLSAYIYTRRKIKIQDFYNLHKMDFVPIPLTREMLEKNGFYDRNAQWYYKRFGSYVCFDIAISLIYREIEVSKVCGAGTDCEEEEYGSSIVFGNDIYVHTLQHALRLCGLNELADNFKV